DLDVSSLDGGQVYNISVDVVAGDDSSVQSASDTDPPGFVRCESNLKSSQFCAEAKLSSSVSINTGALNVSNIRKNGIIVKKGGQGHGVVISSVDSANYHGQPPTPTDSLLCGITCQVVYPDITPVILDI